jgi:hypothetical protein
MLPENHPNFGCENGELERVSPEKTSGQCGGKTTRVTMFAVIELKKQQG